MSPLETTTLCRGRYRLLEILGEGGMAVVYKAFDEHLRIDRAIKLLVPAAARIPEARARLETEARAMATLAHPNVVSVFDIRRDDGDLFLVMEFVSGGTLWDWVRHHGPMPPRLAVRLMLPVLDALQAAHQEGIIHRDLKPPNVMLDSQGIPKIADFGIAHVKAPLADGSYTRTGTVLGTWAYMAPEQRHSARTVDARTDLYSLGATLFSLITGEHPFDLFAADQDRRLLEGIPEPLIEPICRATRYRPDDRYQSAPEMAAALEATLPLLDPLPDNLPLLGIPLQGTDDPAGATAGLSTVEEPPPTGGPAANLLFDRRHQRTDPFEGDDPTGGELSAYWKLLAIVGPALAAAVAGGMVMLSREEVPGVTTRHETTVLVQGDALRVTLIDAQGQPHEPGVLPPGTYRIEAAFDQAHPQPAGELLLLEGATVNLRCDATTRRCEEEPAS